MRRAERGGAGAREDCSEAQGASKSGGGLVTRVVNGFSKREIVSLGSDGGSMRLALDAPVAFRLHTGRHWSGALESARLERDFKNS